MAAHSSRRLPRGINFLLGGTIVAVGFALFFVFGGSFNLAVGAAPDVRIDETATASR
ncbi:hypothetical protein [Jannaschia marina]|uniref:hypothetical protein n=1 Tax=Jannaschia marina TaxID=2741674 RepID=UPI0015CA39FC|nr:hypothetical protein [Jannaschia marina]